MPILRQSDGQDSVVIYVENPKAMKRLPPSDSVSADDGLIEQLVCNFWQRECETCGERH